ncbi:MAG: penicillin-binding transpeptidase domain-containing protein [Pseudomonadota bacterium]
MKKHPIYPARRVFLLSLFVIGLSGLFVRSVYLQLFEHEFLEEEGKARHLRVVEIPAHRGMVLDRNGELLAVSTPIHSVWANPLEALQSHKAIRNVALILGINADSLIKKLQAKKNKQFLYVKRHIGPSQAQKLNKLDAQGIHLKREYRRYYPTGEVSSHLLGFTDIDDKGLEGIELAYEKWLQGKPGAKKVIKDSFNRVVEDVEALKIPEPGRDVMLSIDRRIQYLAYRELKAQLTKHRAKAASAVLMDAKTGEILAMANTPSFNPNNRKGYSRGTYRNRAVTDVYEPGSTMKPFTVASALESQRYTQNTIVDTTPGKYQIGEFTIRDYRNYGVLTLGGIILKSSTVGAAKVAQNIPAQELWSTFSSIGVGQSTESGFPGEVAGHLKSFHDWHKVEHATMSYGYGMSMTSLQLARAYSVFASGGKLLPVSMLRKSAEDLAEVANIPAIFSPQTVDKVVTMLTAVVSEQGTGSRAAIPGYSVAGKTGTVHKSAKGGYEEDKYISVFAGLAPASDPKLVLVVMVNQPNSGMYFGGEVAAPIFSKIMGGALRILNISPDKVPLQANVESTQDHAG